MSTPRVPLPPTDEAVIGVALTILTGFYLARALWQSWIVIVERMLR